MLRLGPSDEDGGGTGLGCFEGSSTVIVGGVLADNCFIQERGIRASGGGGAAGGRWHRFLLVSPVRVSIM